MAFEIATYPDRIGLAQVPTTLDGLLALQQAQMRAIAYENFDVLLGDIADLTESRSGPNRSMPGEAAIASN